MRAIIFDMDGLLVESESVWAIAEDAMLTARGIPLNPAAREALIGLRMDEFMTKMRTIFNLPESADELGNELIQRMLLMIPELVKPQPGAREMTQYVVAHNIPRAIASSSPEVIIHATVKAQGWEDVFAVRYSAEHEKFGKPAPDVYLRAAEKIGVLPNECLALEDSPNGARAAVAAGMMCYAVPDLTHTRPEAFASITPHVFSDLHAVLQHLNTNGVITNGNK
jgi:mannitol-1-/sugar-/sorbitol-6-/2-deoxyglucose-6-phosphatase